MAEQFKHDANLAELYDPAMKITEQTEADAYFVRLVEFGMSHGQDRAYAEKVQRSNLGYYAGYYDQETRRRVERLFACHHPVFGPISLMGSPTVEEALQAGKDLAEGRCTED